MVLGGHGDTMVPMPKQTKIKNKILTDLVKENKISKSKLDEIVNRTRKGGAEIVKLLEKGSAFYAPAASGVEMAESFIKDQKNITLCSIFKWRVWLQRYICRCPCNDWKKWSRKDFRDRT